MVVDNASLGVKFSRKLGNDNTLWVTTKKKGGGGGIKAAADCRGRGSNGRLMQHLETGTSQCVTLCGILVFDGPLCYLISKVSLCVKVLLPPYWFPV